jgi:hypothetical protein
VRLRLHQRGHTGDDHRDRDDEGEEQPAGLAEQLRLLVVELLLLDRGDLLEQVESVGGLLDLLLEGAERDVPSSGGSGARCSASSGKLCCALRACSARRCWVRE